VAEKTRRGDAAGAQSGEKAFVDWAGSTIPIYDRTTGVVWQASLFVAALGASSYTWAEATRDQQMEAWLHAHMHAFDYWGGVPALAVGRRLAEPEHEAVLAGPRSWWQKDSVEKRTPRDSPSSYRKG
jgi:hypothetical protein